MNDPKKQHASLVRRGDVTPALIGQQVEKLGKLTAQLSAFKVAMETEKVRSMTVDGVKKIEKAEQLVREYLSNLQQAMIRRQG